MCGHHTTRTHVGAVRSVRPLDVTHVLGLACPRAKAEDARLDVSAIGACPAAERAMLRGDAVRANS